MCFMNKHNDKTNDIMVIIIIIQRNTRKLDWVDCGNS